MSYQQLKAFLEAVEEDSALQMKMRVAANANAVVAIAESAGFEISLEDLKDAETELSDEVLEAVVGGGLGMDGRAPWT